MKKLIIKLLPAIFLIMAVCLYMNLYNIRYDDLTNSADLKNDIKSLEQDQPESKFNVGRYADFEGYRYTLLLFNNKKLGIVKLKKGLNNRYKIESIDIDNYVFSLAEIKPIGNADKHNAYLIYGNNTDRSINSISYTMSSGTTIERKVPDLDYFIYGISYFSSDNGSGILSDFNIFDKQHNVIHNNYHFGNTSVSTSESGSLSYLLIFINTGLSVCFIVLNIAKH